MALKFSTEIEVVCSSVVGLPVPVPQTHSHWKASVVFLGVPAALCQWKTEFSGSSDAVSQVAAMYWPEAAFAPAGELVGGASVAGEDDAGAEGVVLCVPVGGAGVVAEGVVPGVPVGEADVVAEGAGVGTVALGVGELAAVTAGWPVRSPVSIV
ncbi:hypothetical protein ABTY61_25510 [Kitasatospora sp. NPDC096128]|uniref:hypothetical protein n=1 Tax=Kitasatospora sp. NPDC096128 TaxID=3155547 RepID=UPI003333DD2F